MYINIHVEYFFSVYEKDDTAILSLLHAGYNKVSKCSQNHLTLNKIYSIM